MQPSSPSSNLPSSTVAAPRTEDTARVTRPPASLIAALVAAAIVALLPNATFFQSVERWTQDLRFHARGPIVPRTKIVIAELDQKSEKAWSHEPMVFWTGHYGDMIRSARAAGSSVIGLDLIPEVSGQRYLEAHTPAGAPTEDGPDTRFATAIQDAGDGAVVFADKIAANTAGGTYLRKRPDLPADLYLQMPEVADNLGFTDLPSSPDGVVRESFRSALAEDGGDPVPSFATLVAARARMANGSGPLNPFAATPRTSDDALPAFYVDYTGRDFPHISAVDLATNSLQPDERSRLRDAIVLIGFTAPDSTDWHAGPDSRLYSGVGLHAQAIATLLDGRTLRGVRTRTEALIALALGIAAALLTAACVLGSGGRRAGAGADALALLLVGVIWTLTAYSLFVHAHFLLPVAAPLLALILPCLTFRAVHAATEWLRRTQVETLFGHYASPEISQYLIQNPNLPAEVRDITVLFLDIRGSTDYAQRFPPEVVLGELNEMFQGFNEIVQDRHGLLSRYTGDGFLAIFGAPKPSHTHADDAILCAVDLLREAERINEKRTSRGLEHWSVGCSVNSGRAAAGKLGFAERFDYTVIGDVVNRAAKIESKNKNPDGTVFSDLVITDATLSRAFGIDRIEELQTVQSATDVTISGSRETTRLSFYRLVGRPAPSDRSSALVNSLPKNDAATPSASTGSTGARASL